ncbi:type IV secretion system protein [Vibrio vulnificus]|uniref:type IV secretion system protein n=1 Tax=Vibrio vulnificus TaxID=672 RepID=UPI004057EB6F
MFETIFEFLDKAVALNVSMMVGRFVDVISPLIGVFVVIYFIYLSKSLLFEPQKDAGLEYAKAVSSLIFLTFVAFSVPWYQENIVPAVLYIGDDIANALLGSDSASSAVSLQTITDEVIKQNGIIWDTIDVSFTDASSFVHGVLASGLIIISFLGFLPFISISTAYLMTAKIMVSFLLIIGPLYIMFGFFPSTRDMFKSWSGMCLNYILLSVIYPLAFRMFLQLLGNTGLNGNITAISVLLTFIVMFALILLTTQIPTFTSALSGGIGINGLVGGIGASADAAGNSMVNAGKTMAFGWKLGKAAKERVSSAGKGKVSPG